MEPWSLVPWRSDIDRSGFDCGQPSLNDWLQQQAGQAERRDSARTFLAIGTDGRIVGYLSLCVAQLAPEVVTSPAISSRYPIPAVRLAKLAVDVRDQGCGVGTALLAHAVRLAHEVMQRAAIQVLVVDALDDNVASFYERWGFARFHDDPTRLFLTSRQIRASVPEARP